MSFLVVIELRSMDSRLDSDTLVCPEPSKGRVLQDFDDVDNLLFVRETGSILGLFAGH